MTTAVSIPLTKILMGLMQASGRYEFRARYGHLATEIIKRSNFLEILRRLSGESLEEQLNVYEQRMDQELHKLAEEWIAMPAEASATNNNAATNAAAAAVSSTLEENFEEMTGINLIFETISSFCSRNEEKLKRRFKKQMESFIKHYKNKPLIVSPLSYLIIRRWATFPFHTNTSAVCLTVILGWMAWCYTYILGFTSLKSSATTMTIFETVAMSLITSHIITQPLIQLVILSIEKWKQRRQAPEEYNFYHLQELTYKVFTEFVGECSICPWLPKNDARRAALVCPPNMLLKKVIPLENMSADAQLIENKTKYIYDFINGNQKF
jgi:hypothetical protein